MRLAGCRLMLAGMLALLVVGAPAGCSNPFDPLSKSDKIKGLSYIDFSVTWDHWDSDPAYDGVVVAINYYNEFGEALDFNDKDNEFTIEFYSQKKTPVGDVTVTGYDGTPFFTGTFSHKNSADTVRIPVEAYACFDVVDGQKIPKSCESGYGPGLANAYTIDETQQTDPLTPFSVSENFEAFIIVRVHPPKASPQYELEVGSAGNIIYKFQETDVTMNP